MARIQTSRVLDLAPFPCIGYSSVKGENMIGYLWGVHD
jgi:hypothetical protein